MYEVARSKHHAINSTWRAEVEVSETYTDPANEYWGIAFTERPNGATSAELIGPTLAPRTLEGIAGERHWGVEFRPHVSLRGVTKASLLGDIVELPVGADGLVEFGGARHRVPAFEHLETFVDQLLVDGAITSDDDIRRSLRGDRIGFSPRSWQRRFRSTTGLTRKQIEQLARARHAFYLLQEGTSIAEAALIAGYADQSHLTRSLKLIRSETPAQVIARHVSA